MERISMEDINWNDKATNLIKSELAKKGIDYNDLVQRLNAIGVNESYSGIANKISRGSFSLVFFLQCMEAIRIKEVRL
jgi:hypothetical protein